MKGWAVEGVTKEPVACSAGLLARCWCRRRRLPLLLLCHAAAPRRRAGQRRQRPLLRRKGVDAVDTDGVGEHLHNAIALLPKGVTGEGGEAGRTEKVSA